MYYKKLLTTVLISLFTTYSVFSQMSDLIISEYGEGSGNNKYIELYNGTGGTIDLSEYRIWRINNGGSADATIVAVTDLPDGGPGTSFNGDDAVGLAKDDGSGLYFLIDAVGTDGPDPGSGWAVAGTGGATKDNTLVRKDTVCDPNTDWVESAGTNATDSEWIVLASNDWSDIDMHTSSCAGCTPTHTITSFDPVTGPELTHVTITGTGFSVDSEVEFNGQGATIIFANSTTIIAEAPSDVTTGFITVTEDGCTLDSTTNFTLLDISNCTSGGIPTGFGDLMFSGIYDDETDSCHYMELLNPTASDIDLTGYTVGLDNNFVLGSAVPTTGFSGGTLALSGTIAAGDTVMIRLSASGACTSCPSVTPDLSFTNGGFNNNDRVVLVNGTTALDVWQNHSNGAGYGKGYVFSRAASANAPSTTFNNADWDQDGNEDCFGFAIETTTLPTIDSQPSDIINCIASLDVMVTASLGGTITYQWKYYDITAQAWVDVTSASFSPGITTGETSDNLEITGFNLDGYQFYCDIIEDGTCSVRSVAIQVTMDNTLWTPSGWSNGAPTLSSLVVIDSDYNTAIDGSFSACSLIVNSGNTVTVDDSNYIEIENDINVNGDLVVNSKGNLVQNQDDSSFNLNTGGTAVVNKMTTPMASPWEYTYWSSPVTNATVGAGLFSSNPYRRFWFNANNFLDVLIEIDNTDTFIAGSDNIDDNGDDWQYASSGMIMAPGQGFASMHGTTGFVAGNSYQYTFSGEFNNGTIQTPIAYNGANGDNDWNLIGNPYPSAIDTNILFSENSDFIAGVAYLWSHNTAASATASGNQGQNFTDADYAIITSGSGNTAGGDGVIPTDYIPSGQSFFVIGQSAGVVSFYNDMRMADTSSNNQFFRTNNSEQANKLWLNLTTDNDLFSQVLVAYVDGATDGLDDVSYDASRSLSGGLQTAIYTQIDSEPNKKLGVQGKSTTSLNIDETISVGFITTIDEAMLYTFSIAQLEGAFMTSNTIFIKDNLLDVIHNLSTSDYTFTSETGEFNSRFEVVFNDGTIVIEEEEETITLDKFLIVELENDNVQFAAPNDLQINSIRIINVQGKEVYNLKGNNNRETYNLSKLNNTVYFANITLSNGQVITKKAIKK